METFIGIFFIVDSVRFVLTKINTPQIHEGRHEDKDSLPAVTALTAATAL